MGHGQRDSYRDQRDEYSGSAQFGKFIFILYTIDTQYVRKFQRSISGTVLE